MTFNTNEELLKLLAVLKSQGIKAYTSPQFSVEFYDVEQPKPIDTSSHLVEDTLAEQGLPPDLRTDSINSHDSMLNWSAPPSADEEPLPLTGDEPL